MNRKITLVVWLLSVVVSVTNQAQAQTIANGPYYATPSWDQTLACSSTASCPRFIVLSNMNSEAVLDRETGLLWEKSPLTTAHTWSNARFQCTSRTTGGRKGWRLPSVHELASLLDPANSNPALPTGHPFLNLQDVYSSATTNAEFPDFAWVVNFANSVVGNHFFDKTSVLFVWCVRGGMNADQY